MINLFYNIVNYMQNHRGLPKKLPARKNKAKIYSPSISPSRTN